MLRYILKWNKDFKKANGSFVPLFAMENPYIITGRPEKAVKFKTKEEAQKFSDDNNLSNFSIIVWKRKSACGLCDSWCQADKPLW